MRNFIITLFTIIVASSCYNDNDVVDNEARYIPNFGNPEMKEIIGYGPIKKCTEYFYFDNVKEEYGQVVLGLFDFTYEYIFNAEGKVVICDYPGQKDTYEYQDNMCIFNSYYQKQLSRRIINYYNENNQIIKREWFNNQRILTSECTYKYNNNGDEIECFNCMTNKVVSSIEYTYDHNNLITSMTYIDSSKKVSESSIYRHCDDTTTLFVYDDNKNLIKKRTITTDGIIDSLFNKSYIDKVIKYDSKLNELEEQSWYVYNGNNYISIQCTYKYIFDDRGNWIRKETYYTDKEIPSSVVIREIEYY